MRTCVVLNPGAGNVDEGNVDAGSVGDAGAIAAALGRLPEAELWQTRAPGDAERLAAEAAAAGAELVVAAGGDGTLNGVVNGLAPWFGRVRLGLLPLGTGNDFARSIGVPADLEQALAVLVAGRTQRLDVGRTTWRGAEPTSQSRVRHFINMSAGGFSDAVGEQLTPDMKRSWGPLAYLRSAVEALPDLEPYHAVLTLDGGEKLAVETYNVVVSNGRYVAGGIPAAPQARLDDGLFDVMIVPAASIPRLAVLVPLVLVGRHVDSDLLIFRRTARLKIASRPPMPFNLDGEPAGDTPIEYEVLARALEVVVGEIEEPRAEPPTSG